jgi:hypothetical protein
MKTMQSIEPGAETAQGQIAGKYGGLLGRKWAMQRDPAKF